jgi:hypothetical protein
VRASKRIVAAVRNVVQYVGHFELGGEQELTVCEEYLEDEQKKKKGT